jgi:hypothetical protein
LASSATLPVGAPEGAAHVASEYLSRAGLSLEKEGIPVELPAADTLSKLSGRPELLHAAAAFAGAISAVESIKRALRLGTCASPLHGITLSPEDV